ncbi:hypothetical protein SLEP1_g11123 [Rubroshorea leprosula]|uniref:F-box domain-containing protein n=1 Tax=Rubroshorea leprosula TaxID=152421 RepID=A0AAV5IIT0_9ROSI|nr:hypothetical protein SLEP1_g11123 [Rubroshorea leprosula]
MGSDWTQLPSELLESISKKLNIYADYLRFQAVCRSWQSAAPKIPHHLPLQPPWLMLPPTSQQTYRAVFDLSTHELHCLSLPEDCTKPSMSPRGSSQGWLFILDLSPNIFLLNPLTRSKLDLPPLYSFPNVRSFDSHYIDGEYMLQSSSPQGFSYRRSSPYMRDCYIKKVVLSSSPSKDPNFVATAIVNFPGQLVYCRSGDDSWSVTEVPNSFSEDVIYFHGSFYTVNNFGDLAVCDLSGASPQVSFIRTPRTSPFRCEILYLVGSDDGLFLLARHHGTEWLGGNDGRRRTFKFDVFRLNWSGPVWEEVTSLEGKTLFVGESSSFSLRASDFPGCKYKENCIYYTEEYSESNFDYGMYADRGGDIGIYNVVNGNIESLPTFFFQTLQWPPPIWVTPNPW